MKHVVVYDGSDGTHQPMEMECLGCGATTTPHLPIPAWLIVTYAVLPLARWLWIASFEREHATCAAARRRKLPRGATG